MKLKELIARVLRGEELNALERAELEQFDPDELRDKLDAAERSRLTREEALQRDLDSAVSERDGLRSELDGVVRKNRISAIAAAAGCVDPEYLDFLAGKGGVNLDDDSAVAEFVAAAEKNNPHCFRSRLRPGGGGPAPAAGTEKTPPVPDRIGAIVEALGSVPEVI